MSKNRKDAGYIKCINSFIESECFSYFVVGCGGDWLVSSAYTLSTGATASMVPKRTPDNPHT